MKSFFVILALCLVSSQAAFTPTNYEGLDNDITQESEKVTVGTAYASTQECKEVYVDPLQKVEKVIVAIESSLQKNKACAVAKKPAVINTLKVMHDELNVCREVADKKSGQQIIFDDDYVAKLPEKCKNHKSTIKYARKSIETIKQAKYVPKPAVCAENDPCAHAASDKAAAELNLIASEIDSCIG